MSVDNFPSWFLNFIDAIQHKTFSINSKSSCICPYGFFGQFCELKIDSCAMLQFELGFLSINNVCLNGGVCISDGFIQDKDIFKTAHKNGLTAQRLGVKCKCPSGFTG